MQLSKAQVFALLVGASQATTIASNLNGSADAATATLAAGQKLTTKSSLTKCDLGGSACKEATEECGQVQMQNTAKTKTNVCVYKYYCNTVGRIAGTDYAMPCWNGLTEPAAMDGTKALTALEGLVLKTGDFKDKTTKYKNMKVLAIDNYQTGVWALDAADSKWKETDKPVNNACVANSACAKDGTECCANWPDTNNRRCIKKELGGKKQTVFPLKDFTPTCAVDTNAPPKSAQDDLAEKAQAKAAAELKAFHDTVEARAKELAGFDKMSVADKTAWGIKRLVITKQRDLDDAADRKAAGIDGKDCNADCKAVYDAEFLKWKKAVFEACKKSEKSVECSKAKELRGEDEKRRIAGKFYTLAKDARTKFTEKDDAEKAKAKSAIVAAAMKTRAAAGKDGSECSATAKCTGMNQCCGTATPTANAAGVTDGQITGMCMTKGKSPSDQKWKDVFDREYLHVCGAKALLASATAFVAAASLM